jgi:hypothetical protein
MPRVKRRIPLGESENLKGAGGEKKESALEIDETYSSRGVIAY